MIATQATSFPRLVAWGRKGGERILFPNREGQMRQRME
jgi:hypothetical protein